MQSIQHSQDITLINVDISISTFFRKNANKESIRKNTGVNNITRNALAIHEILNTIQIFHIGIRASHRCLLAFLKIIHRHTIHHIHMSNDVIIGRANIFRNKSW